MDEESSGAEAGGEVEVGRVLERLRRIDGLRGSSAGGGDAGAVLLGELRALVSEAEAWARAEGDVRARAAVTKLRERAEGMR